jgi:signal transduction histidine kinase
VINPVRININGPVKEVAESLEAQGAFTGIELSMKLAEGLPDILADPAQLGQVVMNILLNAIHAITPPGRIELTTRLNGKNIEVVFTDTGKGIAEEHLRKVFDPFFTTKEASKGTGLGLAVSYGIIKKHNGYIDVASTIGQGTTFTVRLPVNG